MWRAPPGAAAVRRCTPSRRPRTTSAASTVCSPRRSPSPGAPAPRPAACCEDPDVPGGPFLVMEHLADAVSITDTLPDTWAVGRCRDPRGRGHRRPRRRSPGGVGTRWVSTGSDAPRGSSSARCGGGTGSGSGSRAARCRGWTTSPPRWSAGSPASFRPGLVHGDFHVDNCLFARATPRLLAVIDWEMATIGDPLLDLGLLLAFWACVRWRAPAMPALQAVSRTPGAPPVEHLVTRYEARVGHPVGDVAYYRVLALFKLAAIVEAAWSQHLAGDLDTPVRRGARTRRPHPARGGCGPSRFLERSTTPRSRGGPPGAPPRSASGHGPRGGVRTLVRLPQPAAVAGALRAVLSQHRSTRSLTPRSSASTPSGSPSTTSATTATPPHHS